MEVSLIRRALIERFHCTYIVRMYVCMWVVWHTCVRAQASKFTVSRGILHMLSLALSYVIIMYAHVFLTGKYLSDEISHISEVLWVLEPTYVRT